MKDWMILLLYPLTAMACGFLAGYEAGYMSISPLTYSQRRDIAITFMCTEHNTWKGAKNFCGSLPLDSDRDKK